jgi:geranylgeranyl diphosphate synthase type II
MEQRLVAWINERLDAWSRSLDAPAPLKEAIRYALLGPGKRLRPALAIRCCEAAGGNAERALPAAAAVELVHAFSLVHDDLPAMDDDALRRGRPTLHVAHGEALAILAGDAMLALAFQVLTDGLGGSVPVWDDTRLEAALVRELAEATGQMIAGQTYDTIGGLPADASPVDNARRVHERKTGALLRAACRMGARSAGADVEGLARFSRYGGAIGLMFQVVDDLLDVEQSSEHLGKRAGKDEAAGKLTYPVAMGVEGARAEVRRLCDEAIAALRGFGEEAAPLRGLARAMAVRTR